MAKDDDKDRSGITPYTVPVAGDGGQAHPVGTHHGDEYPTEPLTDFQKAAFFSYLSLALMPPPADVTALAKEFPNNPQKLAGGLRAHKEQVAAMQNKIQTAMAVLDAFFEDKPVNPENIVRAFEILKQEPSLEVSEHSTVLLTIMGAYKQAAKGPKSNADKYGRSDIDPNDAFMARAR